MSRSHIGWFAAIFLFLGNSAVAACDVEEALTALQTDVVGNLDAVQRRDARRILLAMCEAADLPKAAGATTETTDATASEETSDGLFGIELRRADADSKGHDRLKKR